MRRCLQVVTCLGVSLSLTTALASATQLAYRSPRELGQQAAVVVRGKVLSVKSYWNDTHTKIFTSTQIAVDETYKGTQRTVLDLVQLGGTVGKVKVTVDGALGWQVGEEVLVFAEPYDASNYQVSGFSQGKFRITRNPVTGTACVDAPPLEGLSLRGAPSPQVPSGGRLKQSPTLDEFVSHALGSSDVPGDER